METEHSRTYYVTRGIVRGIFWMVLLAGSATIMVEGIKAYFRLIVTVWGWMQ